MQKVNNVSFGSKFINNSTLRSCFYDAKQGLYKGENLGKLVKSMESLLNDGKTDIIELSSTPKRNLCYPSVLAKVNDKVVVSNVYEPLCQTSECEAIVDILTNLATKNNPKTNFNLLADYEKKAIQPLTENMKTFVKTQSETSNINRFFKTIDRIKYNINEKLYETNLNRLLEDIKPKVIEE